LPAAEAGLKLLTLGMIGQVICQLATLAGKIHYNIISIVFFLVPAVMAGTVFLVVWYPPMNEL
jgi:hypothetical protein